MWKIRAVSGASKSKNPNAVQVYVNVLKLVWCEFFVGRAAEINKWWLFIATAI